MSVPAALRLLPLIVLVPLICLADDEVDFARQVRPILAKKCFACHGNDAHDREAGLRLDERAGAIARLESGKIAVVPGKPEASELLRRLTTKDEAERMPPAEHAPRMKVAEIELVRRWIKQGAQFTRHWAFIPPLLPALPDVGDSTWPRNALDRFVLRGLNGHKLTPSQAADRWMLIRRLSLDVRGLPPQPEEVQEFVNDPSPDAYERLVDRYLADPSFGERWARKWLDLARYADSRGYGSDPLRPHIWRFRDWVVAAFNSGMPLDRFTVEQLAGDLLPGATLEQRVATAFHRNTMTNTEGGTDDEEFRVAAVKDRVDTTMQVWMGLTMGCAKCHNHKYDPISQVDYYSFYAFFNQTADRDLPSEAPTVAAPGQDMLERLRSIDREIAALKRQLDVDTPQIVAARRKWERSLAAGAKSKPLSGRFVRIELPGNARMLSLAEVQVFSGGTNVATGGKSRHSSTDFAGPAKLAVDGNTNGDYHKSKSVTHTRQENNPWWEVDLGKSMPIERIAVWNRTDGNLESRLAGYRVLILDAKRQPVFQRASPPLPRPSTALAMNGPRSAVPADVLAIVDTKAAGRTPQQSARLASYYRSISPTFNSLRAEIARLEKSKPKPPQVPVMQDLPVDKRRKTHVMVKGNFLAKGQPVTDAVPAAFHPLEKSTSANRLALARWLVDARNPLTARVQVNRFWAQLFGTGLVQTEEDFGTQGELPSHPDLLDWLAVEYQSSGWNTKRLIRTIVTSATYRQTSRVTPELRAADPRNRLLTRGPRFRLEAEQVRDQALALSGLLTRRLYGPSVYPPQPAGLWRAAFNGKDRKWPTSIGADRYRRGVYTFWRRTVPYPSMAAFDAPSREICSVRRIRTNTPIQVFVTLNDPAYVEAAQALARRIVREGGTTTGERLRFALQLVLVRQPSAEHQRVLAELFHSELEHYRQNKDAAVQLATQPLGALPREMDAAELAAWTVVANVLLNLDAAMMKG